MKSHEIECAAEGCDGVALPRAELCRFHFLKDWHRHNEWLKGRLDDEPTSIDTDDEIS